MRPSQKQSLARARNWKIFRLRGLYCQLAGMADTVARSESKEAGLAMYKAKHALEEAMKSMGLCLHIVHDVSTEYVICKGCGKKY